MSKYRVWQEDKEGSPIIIAESHLEALSKHYKEKPKYQTREQFDFRFGEGHSVLVTNVGTGRTHQYEVVDTPGGRYYTIVGKY